MSIRAMTGVCFSCGHDHDKDNSLFAENTRLKTENVQLHKQVEELKAAYVKSDESIQIWVHKYRERGERIKELKEELKTSQKAYVDLWVNAARGEVSE